MPASPSGSTLADGPWVEFTLLASPRDVELVADAVDELRGAEWHWPGVADIVLHRRVCFGLLTCPHQEMWRYFYSVAPEGSEWNVVGWIFQGDEDFCRDAC